MRDKIAIWIVKERYVWPFAWILVGRRYVQGVDEIVCEVIDPVLRSGRRLSEFRILSHGHRRVDPASGLTVGCSIDLGRNERLDTQDLDRLDGPRNGTVTERFLTALRAIMRPGSRLIFSACHQGDGMLLGPISRFIGEDVQVRGYRRIGHPFGSGDIAFRNGIREST